MRHRWFVLVMGTAAACGGEAETSPPGSGVDESEDLRPAWVEELRIGSVERPGPTTFGSIADIEIDASGRIYVLDGDAAEIRLFGSDGRHIRTVGGEGEGPGEFRSPSELFWSPEGDLWVADPVNVRFSVYSPELELLDTRVWQASVISSIWRGGFGSDGRIRELGGRALAILGDDLAPIRSVRFPTLDVPTFSLVAETQEGMAVGISRRVPFMPSILVTMDSRGDPWFASSDEYAIFGLNTDGDTVRIVRRDGVEPLPVTPRDIEIAEEELAPLGARGAEIDLSLLPEVKPLLRSFTVADDGSLWVRVVTEADVEGHRYDLFDASGRFRGRLDTPYPLSRLKIRGERIHAVAFDAFDVPHVVRARIEWVGNE